MKKRKLNRIYSLALTAVLLISIANSSKADNNKLQNNHKSHEINFVTDFEGNVYPVVIIGDQEWMAENLRTTTYSDGTDILTNLNGIDWKNDRSGAYVIFSHNRINGLDSDSAVMAAYGVSYNWYAVDNERGLCPVGWRVPTDAEWSKLTDYLIDNHIDITPENIGTKLRSCRQVNSPLSDDCNTTEHPRWFPDSVYYGTDDFGFSALPGGYCFAYGGLYNFGSLGGWWSSTEDSPTNAWVRFMRYNSGYVNHLSYDKSSGFSVRCVRK